MKKYFGEMEILTGNNYPLQHPEKPGSAILYCEDHKKGITDLWGHLLRKKECNYHFGKGVEKKGKRTFQVEWKHAIAAVRVWLDALDAKFSRCHETFCIPHIRLPLICMSMTQLAWMALSVPFLDLPLIRAARGGGATLLRKKELTYHLGKELRKRVKRTKYVPGGVETRIAAVRVWLDALDAKFSRPASDKGCPGVISIDCEMCYTTHGLELVRVTVVNSSLQVIYDTFGS
ncbi:unnamed protein product [Coregonus sp. 'balchen']|nr:unnamed protein product [Coregonus sp. 'balchen']